MRILKMKRNYFNLNIVLCFMSIFLHFGAMLKADGKEAVLKNTQTDPIAYKTKMDEIKDGIKEAPTPSYQYYGHNNSMSRLPIEKEKDSEREKPLAERIPTYGDPIPEDLRGLDQEETHEDWWFDEWEDSAESPLEAEQSGTQDDFGI